MEREGRHREQRCVSLLKWGCVPGAFHATCSHPATPHPACVRWLLFGVRYCCLSDMWNNWIKYTWRVNNSFPVSRENTAFWANTARSGGKRVTHWKVVVAVVNNVVCLGSKRVIKSCVYILSTHIYILLKMWHVKCRLEYFKTTWFQEHWLRCECLNFIRLEDTFLNKDRLPSPWRKLNTREK